MHTLKSQEEGKKLHHGAHVRPGKKSNYPGQEVETRRDGLQDALREKVAGAVQDTKAHDAARKDQFRREGRTAQGGSAPRALKGAKSK
jgi:hypothetical protein